MLGGRGNRGPKAPFLRHHPTRVWWLPDPLTPIPKLGLIFTIWALLSIYFRIIGTLNSSLWTRHILGVRSAVSLLLLTSRSGKNIAFTYCDCDGPAGNIPTNKGSFKLLQSPSSDPWVLFRVADKVLLSASFISSGSIGYIKHNIGYISSNQAC